MRERLSVVVAQDEAGVPILQRTTAAGSGVRAFSATIFVECACRAVPLAGPPRPAKSINSSQRRHITFGRPSSPKTPFPCSDEDLSNDSRRQRPACAPERGLEIS
jgi:hypothetical protein